VLLGIIRDAPSESDPAAMFDADRRNVHSTELTVAASVSA
jgi:hypothetical protein